MGLSSDSALDEDYILSFIEVDIDCNYIRVLRPPGDENLLRGQYISNLLSV